MGVRDSHPRALARRSRRGHAADSSEILQALSRISEGHLSATANVTLRLLKSLATNEIEPARSEVKALSDRELQVFSLIGRGFGASRLATELHLSVKTIETYQAHIKQKLGYRAPPSSARKLRIGYCDRCDKICN